MLKHSYHVSEVKCIKYRKVFCLFSCDCFTLFNIDLSCLFVCLYPLNGRTNRVQIVCGTLHDPRGGL